MYINNFDGAYCAHNHAITSQSGDFSISVPKVLRCKKLSKAFREGETYMTSSHIYHRLCRTKVHISKKIKALICSHQKTHRGSEVVREMLTTDLLRRMQCRGIQTATWQLLYSNVYIALRQCTHTHTQTHSTSHLFT